jgi:hypothetical protein
MTNYPSAEDVVKGISLRGKQFSSVVVSVRIPQETIDSLLCSALDPGVGGSYYWCSARRQDDEASKAPKWLHEVPLKGGTIVITDHEEGDREVLLTPESLKLGLERLAADSGLSHHLADVLNKNTDAITGDVFLQLCVFGEVIYG